MVGLGKLGLCLAAVLADRGFDVTGVDINKRLVEGISTGRYHPPEPGLDALLRSTRRRMRATTDYDEAVGASDATFVVVPTPSRRSGEFSLKHVESATREIGRSLARKKGYHLVVLSSTVMPGSMEGVVRPTLEGSSGKSCPEEFGLCYNPEFIALGNVIGGLRSPDFVLVGESDGRAGELLEGIHAKVCKNRPPVERMTFVNAELAKIAANAFVTMKMSFANTLAEICERLPEGDVDVVTAAIGRDRRIGRGYMRGAMGYGGPCFPRDNAAFAKFAEKVGVSADLALATDRINKRQVTRVLELIENGPAPRSTRIGILGVAYKQDTNVIEASQPLMLATALARKGFEVHVYDPKVGGEQLKGQGLRVEASADDCVAKSDLCVIATPWPGFSKIQRSRLADKIVLDCWRLLNGNKTSSPSNYLALGHDMALRASAGEGMGYA